MRQAPRSVRLHTGNSSVDDPFEPPARRWIIASALAAAALAIALLLVLMREPEVIHDSDGVPFYRARGGDAEQEAVEACFRLGDREVRYAGLGSDPVVFCCAPRASDVCDLPEGHEKRSENVRRALEAQKPEQPQAYYENGTAVPPHEWTRAVSCGWARWEAGGELRAYDQMMSKVTLPVEAYQRALASHYRIAAPRGVERDAYAPDWQGRCGAVGLER